MKAVILDMSTLGLDISLKILKDQCELTIYNTTSKDEVEQRIINEDIIITNKVVIGQKEMNSAKKLKLICVAATGYNNIDIAEAKKRNIVVANVKAYSTESVAQTVFGYILNFMNSSFKVYNDIKNSLWQKSPVFTMLNHPFNELKGKNLGIIGYGNIGKRVQEIGRAFKMNIFVCESFLNSENNPERIPFKKLLIESDIITIHIPLNEKTKDLISENELLLMKPSAFLINAARGGIVNEKDLYKALVTGEIAGSAVDVLTEEPPVDGNILYNAPNMFITPHIAWTSKEARQNLINGIAKNINMFKNGRSSEINLCHSD